MKVLFTIKNEQVLLRADEFNYELCRQMNQTDKETGEMVQRWVPFKFFASLEQAMNKIIDLKVRTSDARSIAELKAVLEAVRDEVCRTWAVGTAGGQP